MIVCKYSLIKHVDEKCYIKTEGMTMMVGYNCKLNQRYQASLKQVIHWRDYELVKNILMKAWDFLANVILN